MLVARRRVRVRGGAQVDTKKYPHRIQLYTVPPTDEITLEEFESFGYDRLKVLKAIENARLKYPKRDHNYRDAVETACKKHLPLSENRDGADPADIYEQRRKDHISHFVLRLAFCRTEDQRRWLLQQEMELFRFRLEAGTDIAEFLEKNQLRYPAVIEEEKKQYVNELRACGYDMSDDEVMASSYFKLPYTQALELVRQRRVFLRHGYAYVHRNDLVSIVCGSFRAMLSEALVNTAKALPHLEEDDRLDGLLKTMSKTDLAGDYKGHAHLEGKVHISQIDELARRSFPMCARNLHENFKKNHHLKHWGRLQYGLFLKGIGISLEDALAFWRAEFSKAIPVEKFEKEHAYTLRHMYGKEGKRTDYTPYSCVRIITGNGPAQGDHHGCPFKHFDENNLRAKLRDYGIQGGTSQEIIKLVKDHHYQVACAKYFEVTHGLKPEETVVINHPNDYFAQSMKHYELAAAQQQPQQQNVPGSQGSQPMSSTPQSAAPTPAKGSQGPVRGHYEYPTPQKRTPQPQLAPAAAMDLDQL